VLLLHRKKPQGPATSFVPACAFAAVAGALGYKSATTHTTFWAARKRARKHNVWGTRKIKMLG
jgi:hypothetical protein